MEVKFNIPSPSDIGGKIKHDLGKVKKNLKNLSGFALSGYKKLLRRSIIVQTHGVFSQDRKGIATRLYPAIIGDQQAIAIQYSPEFIGKSKKAYSEIASEWKKLGGSEASLRESIALGAKVKSASKGFDGEWSNASGVMAEQLAKVELENPSIKSTEKLTPLEVNAVVKQEATAVDENELSDGLKHLIARVYSIFHKTGADAPPFVDSKVVVEDIPPVTADDLNSKALDNTGTATILGMPKNVFYAIAGTLAVVGAVIIYKKLSKK